MLERPNKHYMTEKLNTFKALTCKDHNSAIADHISATGYNIKWGNFGIIASGKTDQYHCKIKETLCIQELKPPGGSRRLQEPL